MFIHEPFFGGPVLAGRLSTVDLRTHGIARENPTLFCSSFLFSHSGFPVFARGILRSFVHEYLRITTCTITDGAIQQCRLRREQCACVLVSNANANAYFIKRSMLLECLNTRRPLALLYLFCSKYGRFVHNTALHFACVDVGFSPTTQDPENRYVRHRFPPHHAVAPWRAPVYGYNDPYLYVYPQRAVDEFRATWLSVASVGRRVSAGLWAQQQPIRLILSMPPVSCPTPTPLGKCRTKNESALRRVALMHHTKHRHHVRINTNIKKVCLHAHAGNLKKVCAGTSNTKYGYQLRRDGTSVCVTKVTGRIAVFTTDADAVTLSKVYVQCASVHLGRPSTTQLWSSRSSNTLSFGGWHTFNGTLEVWCLRKVKEKSFMSQLLWFFCCPPTPSDHNRASNSEVVVELVKQFYIKHNLHELYMTMTQIMLAKLDGEIVLYEMCI